MKSSLILIFQLIVLVSRGQESKIYIPTPDFIPKQFSDSLRHLENIKYTGIKTFFHKSESSPSFTPTYFELFFFEGKAKKVIARYGSYLETRTTDFPVAYVANYKENSIVSDTVVIHLAADGAKLFEYHLKNGILEGQYQEYFSNGNIKEIKSYNNGYWVFTIIYWSSGNPESIFYYKAKNKSYKIEKFLSNGGIEFECEYEDYFGKRPIKGTLVKY